MTLAPTHCQRMSQNPNSNRKLNTLLLKVSVQKESIEPRIVIKRLKLLLLCRICMQGNVPLQLGIDGGHVHHKWIIDVNYKKKEIYIIAYTVQDVHWV